MLLKDLFTSSLAVILIVGKRNFVGVAFEQGLRLRVGSYWD